MASSTFWRTPAGAGGPPPTEASACLRSSPLSSSSSMGRNHGSSRSSATAFGRRAPLMAVAELAAASWPSSFFSFVPAPSTASQIGNRKDRASGFGAVSFGKLSLPPYRAIMRRYHISSRLNSSRSLAHSDVSLRSEEHTSELQSQSNLVCRL